MANYEVYAKDCIKWWKDQVGKDCGKTNEYSAFMDSYKFYNYPKNGAANSCAIFYDTAIMKTMTPEPNANAGRAILCEPNVDNCGAGCTQKVQYYKQAGRWYPHKVKGCPAQSGDEIFFQKSNGVIYHTGAVVDWDSKGLYVVEGNTNGGKVAQKFYAYSDSKIAGFGRPKWTGWERPKEEKPSDEKPTPAPEKPTEPSTPAPKYKTMTVKVNTVLNVRSTPNGKIVDQLRNGTKVTIYEEKNGWARIGTGRWVFMQYLR